MLKHPAANLRERLVTVREHAGSISATRQREAKRMVRRVVRRLADVAAGLALDDDAIATLCAFRRHFAPEEVAPFHALLARVGRSLRGFSGIAREPRSRTHASGSVRAHRLQSHRARPRIGGGKIVESRLRIAGNRGRLPWLRMLGLFALGGNARRWFEALIRRG